MSPHAGGWGLLANKGDISANTDVMWGRAKEPTAEYKFTSYPRYTGDRARLMIVKSVSMERQMDLVVWGESSEVIVWSGLWYWLWHCGGWACFTYCPLLTLPTHSPHPTPVVFKETQLFLSLSLTYIGYLVTEMSPPPHSQTCPDTTKTK